MPEMNGAGPGGRYLLMCQVTIASVFLSLIIFISVSRPTSDAGYAASLIHDLPASEPALCPLWVESSSRPIQDLEQAQIHLG